MVQLVLMGMWQETGASREKSELKATQVKLRTQKKIHQADTLLENLRWTTQVHAQGTQKPPSIISTILLPLKFIRWVSANDILHPRGGAYQKKAAKSNTFKISFWNSEFGGGKGIYSRYYPCDRVTQLKTGRFTVLNTAQRSQKKKKRNPSCSTGEREAPGSDTCALWQRTRTGDSQHPVGQCHRLTAHVLQMTPPTATVRLLHTMHQASVALGALCIALRVQLFQ